MHDLNNILHIVINDAIDIGFPVPDTLERKIYIDKKQYERVAACFRYKYPEKYEIHLSEDTLRANKTEIKNIIAHEVIHANFLTMTHNIMWKMYCKLMQEKFGYNIQIEYYRNGKYIEFPLTKEENGINDIYEYFAGKKSLLNLVN